MCLEGYDLTLPQIKMLTYHCKYKVIHLECVMTVGFHRNLVCFLVHIYCFPFWKMLMELIILPRVDIFLKLVMFSLFKIVKRRHLIIHTYNRLGNIVCLQDHKKRDAWLSKQPKGNEGRWTGNIWICIQT